MRPFGRFGIEKRTDDVHRALRAVIERARRRIPYYRELFRDVPANVGLANLACLPITTKADLVDQQELSRICQDSWLPVRRVIGTSGTTGQVLFVRMSRTESFYRSVLFYRSLRHNASLTWPLAVAELGTGPYVGAARPSVFERSSMIRLERIPRILPVETQVERLIRHAPHVITGQATCLEVVARYLLQSRHRVQTRLVVSRGEVLAPHVRALLQRAFEARVADYYNCEEVGNIAYECPAGSSRMHVNTDGCVLEIVDEAGVPVPLGREGRVVVTNLFNHTMPFIRYDLGDRGVLMSGGGERCACGSRLPVMESPAGRTDDFFRFSDGSRLGPRTVEAYVVPPMLMLLTQRNPHAIGSPLYQIIQEEEGWIRVRIVGRLGLEEELRILIESAFRAAGYDVCVTLEQVDEIPVSESGKSRRILSRVGAARQP